MPINIHSVRNHLNENGWQLVSETYKNLHTELEMICPKGHKQLQTYDQWRKHPICNKCLGGNATKINKGQIPIKKIDTERVIGLDAATNITGFSVYDNGDLVYYGTFTAKHDAPTDARINEIKNWLLTIINEWKPDFIGLENIQLQSFGHGQYQVEMYRVLANLQGVLLDVLYETQIPHELVYSSTWRQYCNVGNDKKREDKKKAAQAQVKNWYQQTCTQDEADAICIGKYFVHLLQNNKSSNWGEEIK